ncbi:hypothetical protein GOV07_04335 [Candidatus Woesearchaeota archaeon]|nr:hypothetical protein [Candidatus Woesearchaeota archaeon]
MFIIYCSDSRAEFDSGYVNSRTGDETAVRDAAVLALAQNQAFRTGPTRRAEVPSDLPEIVASELKETPSEDSWTKNGKQYEIDLNDNPVIRAYLKTQRNERGFLKHDRFPAPALDIVVYDLANERLRTIAGKNHLTTMPKNIFHPISDKTNPTVIFE